MREITPLSLEEEDDFRRQREQSRTLYSGHEIDRLLATIHELRGHDALYAALRHEQHTRCAYRTRHGDGRTCDCKFGVGSLVDHPRGEMTGCPELRTALMTLEKLYPGIADRA